MQKKLNHVDNVARFDFVSFPRKVCIQLTDPSSGIAIIELLRILIDEEGLSFTQAWLLVSRTFNYAMTSYTSASLKSLNRSNELKLQVSDYWDFDIVQRVLPRHAELILYLHTFVQKHAAVNRPQNESQLQTEQRLARIGLLIQRDEGGKPAQYLRLSNLCFLGCNRVNGVSPEQTDFLKTLFYRELDDLFPRKLCNISTGMSQR